MIYAIYMVPEKKLCRLHLGKIGYVLQSDAIFGG